MKKLLSSVKYSLLLLIIGSTGSVNAQCTISNHAPDPWASMLNSNFDYVQSFTADCNGDMLYFQLISTQAGTFDAGTIEVYDGNVASGTPIYTQSHDDIVIATVGDPITINITGYLPLVSGNQYSFRFDATPSMNFEFTTNNTYAGGQAWQNGTPYAPMDFNFDIGIGSPCTANSITPDLATLPMQTEVCSINNPTIPTATNDCGAVVNGAPDVTFPISTVGTTQVTWTYADGQGNTTTQTQDFVVTGDVTPPVPDVAQLPDLTNQCDVQTLVAPTATDDCGGTITGTTTTTAPITTLGSTTITWTFDDGNGNVSTQIQNVVNPTIDNTITVSGGTLEANQASADYQWLDCDSGLTPIAGETNQSYSPAVSGNYAVEINVQGCVDTSMCEVVDFSGIEELLNTKKELVKIVDLLGRETSFTPNTPLIYIYSDGTTERVMEVE